MPLSLPILDLDCPVHVHRPQDDRDLIAALGVDADLRFGEPWLTASCHREGGSFAPGLHRRAVAMPVARRRLRCQGQQPAAAQGA